MAAVWCVPALLACFESQRGQDEEFLNFIYIGIVAAVLPFEAFALPSAWLSIGLVGALLLPFQQPSALQDPVLGKSL